jgi:hypothetical protein
MSFQHSPDIVADPVGHISISGVHGGAELDNRLRAARPQLTHGQAEMLKPFLLGAALGAALIYLLKR